MATQTKLQQRVAAKAAKAKAERAKAAAAAAADGTGAGAGTGASAGAAPVATSSSSSSSGGAALAPGRKKVPRPGPPPVVEGEDGNLGAYKLGSELGRGGAGVVRKGVIQATGEVVAIKTVRLEGMDEKALDDIEREIHLMRGLSHTHVVRYIDALRSRTTLYIIMEYMEKGSLSSVAGKLTEPQVALYIAQTLRGLAYLHAQGVIHRDIKGPNILLSALNVAKLADFGAGVQIKPGEGARKSDSLVGTPYWMAPELITQTGVQSSACDIWSVGCTVIELYTGHPPYWKLNQSAACFKMASDLVLVTMKNAAKCDT